MRYTEMIAKSNVTFKASKHIFEFLKKFMPLSGAIPSPDSLRRYFVPKLKVMAAESIKNAIGNAPYSVSFDSSTDAKNRQVYATVLIPENSERGLLCDVTFPDAPVDNVYITNTVKTVLGRYNLKPENCSAIVSNSHAANLKSYNAELKNYMPSAMLILCLCHKMNNVHGIFPINMPLVCKLLLYLHLIFTASGKKRAEYREYLADIQFPVKLFQSYSKSRWNTWFESAAYVWQYFLPIKVYIETLAPKSQAIIDCQKLFERYTPQLQLNLHFLFLIGPPLSAALKFLESTSVPTAPYAYQVLNDAEMALSRGSVLSSEEFYRPDLLPPLYDIFLLPSVARILRKMTCAAYMKLHKIITSLPSYEFLLQVSVHLTFLFYIEIDNLYFRFAYSTPIAPLSSGTHLKRVYNRLQNCSSAPKFHGKSGTNIWKWYLLDL